MNLKKHLFLLLTLLLAAACPAVTVRASSDVPQLVGSAEILAEKVSLSEIKAGDKFVIVSPSSEKVMSLNLTKTRVASSTVTLDETASRQVITGLPDDAAVFELTANDDGTLLLRSDAGYLTATSDGRGLHYTDTLESGSVWQLEGDSFLYSPNTSTTGSDGAVYTNYYLEYYYNYFTVYRKFESSSPTAYTLAFYRLGNSDPDDVIPETSDYCLPLFETSDIHGYLADTSGDDPLYLLAYISDKVKDVRGYGDSARNDRAILLDGGDIYQGNTMSNLFYGHPLSAAFSIMDYDAVTIGNHEFDWGIENVIDPDFTMMDYSFSDVSGVNSVPVINANIYLNGEKAPLADDYIILEKTAVNEAGETLPVKIGVIGYAGEFSDAIMYNMFTGAGYTIKIDYDAVKALAAELESSEACDATILLIHEDAVLVAEELGDGGALDLLLGGHTHTSTVGQSAAGLPYLEPESYGAAYSYAELTFALEDGSPVFKNVSEAKTVNTKDDTSLLTNTAENADNLDPEIVTLTDKVLAELAEVFSTKVGYITESASRELLEGGAEDRNCSIGEWMSSIIRRIVGADVGFVNGGGIRTEIFLEDGADSRDITLSDIYTMFPFGNKAYCYELTWEEFMTALNYALTDKGATLLNQVSGIDVYFTDQTVNAIITDDGEEVYVNGEWQGDWKDKTLRVAINEYVASNNRVSTDGVENPFVAWNDTDRLIEIGAPDNEGAIKVLTAEAAENEGLLFVDTTPHFINAVYVPEVTPTPEPAESTPGSISPTTGEDNSLLIWLFLSGAVCALLFVKIVSEEKSKTR